jgi:hypothetical protein
MLYPDPNPALGDDIPLLTFFETRYSTTALPRRPLAPCVVSSFYAFVDSISVPVTTVMLVSCFDMFKDGMTLNDCHTPNLQQNDEKAEA